MAELYYLIFLGINPEVADRKAAIDSISKLLEANANEIEYLLENKLSAALKENIPMETIRQYQHDMAKIGALCNYRRSRWDAGKLELAPVEVQAKEFIFSCPACGHKTSVPTEEDLPSACPACGIIPSKFEKVSGYKQGRGTAARQIPPSLREQPPQEPGRQPGTGVPQFPQYPQVSLMENAWPEPSFPKKAAQAPAIPFVMAILLLIIGAGMGGAGASAYYELKHRVAEKSLKPQVDCPKNVDTPTPQPQPSPETAPETTP